MRYLEAYLWIVIWVEKGCDLGVFPRGTWAHFWSQLLELVDHEGLEPSTKGL